MWQCPQHTVQKYRKIYIFKSSKMLLLIVYCFKMSFLHQNVVVLIYVTLALIFVILFSLVVPTYLVSQPTSVTNT